MGLSKWISIGDDWSYYMALTYLLSPHDPPSRVYGLGLVV